MCLLLIAARSCPGYRLVVAANRDEFHCRPSAAAAYWNDQRGVLAGRDLESLGTWLGIEERGRFATVTNVRYRATGRAERSRGLLVSDFLTSQVSAADYLLNVAEHGDQYDGFNLLVDDGRQLCWYSNQGQSPQSLTAGVYTLSNASLDTRWPKTDRLRSGFADIIAEGQADPSHHLLELLRDSRRSDADESPSVDVGDGVEDVLSSIFIEGAAYGTRCSTVVLIDERERVTFHERRFDAHADLSGENRFEFELAGVAA